MNEVTGYVWDASSLLTLAATGRSADVITYLQSKSYVESRVLAGEVLYLRPFADEESIGGKIEINGPNLVARSGLEIVNLDDNEVSTYVQFAVRIDDGEARSAAVAFHRGLVLVTDDRDALRLARDCAPAISTLQTPDWLYRWSIQAQFTTQEISLLARRIDVKAHYKIAKNHPLRDWWQNHMSR